MRILVALLLVVVQLASCSSDEEEMPVNIIDREVMIDILSDIHIFESADRVRTERNKKDFELYAAYVFVFEQYEVTESDFKSSIEYYSSDPKDFEMLYDEVIIRISEKQKVVNGE